MNSCVGALMLCRAKDSRAPYGLIVVVAARARLRGLEGRILRGLARPFPRLVGALLSGLSVLLVGLSHLRTVNVAAAPRPAARSYRW